MKARQVLDKFVLAMYVFCVVQFVCVFIFTLVVKDADKKMLLTISAILGLVISSVVRQTYTAYLVDESTKPLDEQILKNLPKNE